MCHRELFLLCMCNHARMMSETPFYASESNMRHTLLRLSLLVSCYRYCSAGTALQRDNTINYITCTCNNTVGRAMIILVFKSSCLRYRSVPNNFLGEDEEANMYAVFTPCATRPVTPTKNRTTEDISPFGLMPSTECRAQRPGASSSSLCSLHVFFDWSNPIASTEN